MASEIDPTVFRDNQPVDKADLRAEFTTAKTEITELQSAVKYVHRLAFGDADFDTL